MVEMGKLVICPTPLGNLGDITVRTLEALRGADTVCAEDTRVTGKLLAAYDISKRLERLDEAQISHSGQAIVERVLAGERIAYCSDAGMPGISDPGMRLVDACRRAGAPVEVLPGPTAAALAYVASGTSHTSFFFGGFLPRKDAAREKLLRQVGSLDAALVFYESPHRVLASLRVIAAVFPSRAVSLCRELTKLHEEVLTMPASELLSHLEARVEQAPLKGEVVLVIDGPSKLGDAEGAADADEIRRQAYDFAIERSSEGMRGKQIAKMIADQFGLSRNEAYELAVQASSQRAEGQR